MPGKICLVAALTAMGLAAGISRASEPAGELEEVVVTARFRDSELLKSSGSVSVVPQASLLDRGARHLEDALTLLPNVNFSSGASRARFIQVRGVGDLEQFVDPKYFPSVGVTIDDVDMNGVAAAAVMMDTRQVEVLRGPQGTQFGTNALAGMVSIRSNEPTDEFTGYAQAGIGKHNSRNLAAALSGPLAPGLLARLALGQVDGDGHVRNAFRGVDDSNGHDEFSVRGKLRWLGQGDNYAELTVFHVNADNGYDAFSLDGNRRSLADEPGLDQQQLLTIAGRGYWRFRPRLGLETIVSHSDADTHYSYDEDWSNPGVCAGLADCYPYANSDRQWRERDTASLDTRLVSAGDGPFAWLAGVYAQRRQEDFSRQYYGDFGSRYETHRYAAYAQLDIGLGAAWRLVGGARFEAFRDSYDDSNGLRSRTDDRYLTGEVTLQHDLPDGSLVYATLSRGVKPGGVNTEASSVFGLMDPKFRAFMSDRLQFGSESLLNKEVGVKGRYLSEALSLRAAMFHMDRRGAQLESWIWDDVNYLWVGYLDSVRKGFNYGLELELDYRLSPALEVFAAVGWLKTDVQEMTVVDLGEPGAWTASAIRVVSDREQTKAPRRQYSLGGNLQLTPRLTARVELEGRSDSLFGYYHEQQLAGYTLFHASLGYRVGAATIRVWGRNLGNRDYAVHGLYFANDPRKGYVNEVYRQFGEPRVFGVDVRYEFR